MSDTNLNDPDELQKARSAAAWLIVAAFPAVLAMILGVVVCMLVVLQVDQEKAQPIDRMAVAASLQVGLGMCLGFVICYFGIAMTWVGIEAAFRFGAGTKRDEPAGSSKLLLQSASPGLFFALLGAILIGVSLNKKLVFEDGYRPPPLPTVPTINEAASQRN